MARINLRNKSKSDLAEAERQEVREIKFGSWVWATLYPQSSADSSLKKISFDIQKAVRN